MFDIQQREATLVFEDGSLLDGARVRVSLDLSLGDFFNFTSVSRDSTDESPVTAAEVEPLRQAFVSFGNDCLLDWDLAIRGEALPANAEGMLRLPLDYARALVEAYTAVASDLPKVLSGDSVNGGTPALATSLPS
jgi:hypothetical protein